MEWRIGRHRIELLWISGLYGIGAAIQKFRINALKNVWEFDIQFLSLCLKISFNEFSSQQDMKILPFVFLLCSSLALCSCVTRIHGIPNLDTVWYTSVYRGGQPNHEGWVYLKNAGVTNVIKLNEKSEWGDKEAESLGMTVHYYPISLEEQMVKVNGDKIWQAVSNISPCTFIHCEHGQDRTGLIIACDEVRKGYPKKLAEKEMLDHGFHKSLRGLWEFWEDNVK